jgi:hypothetical protein
MPKLLPCRSNIPDTPSAFSGLPSTMMSRLSAIAIDGEARYAFFLEKRLGRLSGPSSG